MKFDQPLPAPRKWRCIVRKDRFIVCIVNVVKNLSRWLWAVLWNLSTEAFQEQGVCYLGVTKVWISLRSRPHKLSGSLSWGPSRAHAISYYRRSSWSLGRHNWGSRVEQRWRLADGGLGRMSRWGIRHDCRMGESWPEFVGLAMTTSAESKLFVWHCLTLYSMGWDHVENINKMPKLVLTSKLHNKVILWFYWCRALDYSPINRSQITVR